MKRLTLIAAAVVGALTLLTTGVWAQGWGGGRGARWANVSQEDVERIADLHQKIRQAQWELWTLKAQNADPDKIERKQNEVLRLRGELAKIMTNLPPGPCFQAGGTPPQPGAGLGFGMGRRARAMAPGRGGGWGGFGWCWRLPSQTPQK